MTRYLCWLAVLGVVALPDWASACWRLRHHTCTTYSYPSYPIYYTYPACVPPPECCPQAQGRTYPPPRVEAVPKAMSPSAGPTHVPAATPTAAPPPPSPGLGTRQPNDQNNGIRPAGGSDAAVSPIPMSPMPKKAEIPPTEPFPLPKVMVPSVEIPKDLGPSPKPDVPKEPEFRPIPVPAPAPMPKEPGMAPGGVAVPSAAPAFPEPLIPPTSVPVLPNSKKPDSLPSLTLPPDTPIAPPKDSTSRSSPVSDRAREMTVSVFPANNTAGVNVPREGYKTVGFYNHTARDLSLTIEGQAVKLPAKTYLEAKLAPTFTWGHGNNPTVRESVPAGAGGVDVVFRE